MAMPIIRDGKVEGVIAAGLNVEWLGQQLQQRGVQIETAPVVGVVTLTPVDVRTPRQFPETDPTQAAR